MNKIGVVERREQCRQVGHNAPIKSQGGKRQRCEDKKKKGCKTDNLDEDRVPQGRGEGIFPKGYVRALLSVSARHSLTSARAWIIPETKHTRCKDMLNQQLNKMVSILAGTFCPSLPQTTKIRCIKEQPLLWR